jgi:hypothetical protein
MLVTAGPTDRVLPFLLLVMKWSSLYLLDTFSFCLCGEAYAAILKGGAL